MSEHKIPADQKPRRHDWHAIIEMPVTELEVARAMRTGGRVQINPQMVMNTDVMLGCMVCEQPANEAWGKPCPGDPGEQG